MIVQFNYSHEVFLEMMSAIPEIEIYCTGGNVVESEREDWLKVHGSVPDNINFGRHDNPDAVVQGDDPDVRVTNNRGVVPRRDEWTVYTTETKLAKDPPPGDRFMLIRKGVDVTKFSGWQANLDAPVVTTTNNIQNRPKAAAQAVHNALLESDLDYRAYGRYNEGGFLPHNEMATTLKGASVYANLSKTISPNAVYEAMGVGMPIVTVPGYGAQDAVTHGYNGLVADAPALFVKHVRALLDDPKEAKRLGKNARKTALGRYSRSEFIWRWRVLLKTVTT